MPPSRLILKAWTLSQTHRKMCSKEALDSIAAERDPGAQDTGTSQEWLLVETLKKGSTRTESSRACHLVLN